MHVLLIKADLLAQYGGVSPKMAEEAHSQVIDQVILVTHSSGLPWCHVGTFILKSHKYFFLTGLKTCLLSY